MTVGLSLLAFKLVDVDAGALLIPGLATKMVAIIGIASVAAVFVHAMPRCTRPVAPELVTRWSRWRCHA